MPPIPGVTLGHHDLSHHGQDPAKIAQLKTVEFEKLKVLRDLLAKLKETKEEGGTLLDRTMVFFSSNLGNASSHSVRTCRSSWPAAASSTASTWPSTRRTRRRCATSTSACCSGWASRRTSSAPARGRSRAWT